MLRDRERKRDVGGDEEEEGGGISCECGMVLDLQALPEGCITHVISLTNPVDACRLSAVSTIFRSAAESDFVWNGFLPPDIHTILSTATAPLSPKSFKSRKDFYLALCGNPVLIHEGKMSFSLDKWSGKKCYMISARDLSIAWGDTPHYWRWISVPDSRFEEVADLVEVCWLEIRGKIGTGMLSPSTVYKAYLVFKANDSAYGFEYQPVEVTMGVVGGEVSKRIVFFDGERRRNQGQQIVQRRRRSNRRRSLGFREIDEERYPKERADGWLEIELGEFFYQGGGEEELEMTCLEITGAQWKAGLVVQGIELRLKSM